MKKWLMLTLTAILAVTVTACGGGKKDLGGTDKDGKKIKLVMATSPDYAPYGSLDEAGNIVGFDVDIAKYLAQKLNFDLEIKNIPFDDLIKTLTDKQADFVMAGMIPKEDRKNDADFSDIYYEAHNSIVSKKDSGLKKKEDLSGKKIGVKAGTDQESFAGELGAEVDSAEQTSELVDQLKSGDIDAAIIETRVAKKIVEANPELSSSDIEKEQSEEPAGPAIAFPKGSDYVDDINGALKEMKDSGELDKLIAKWFE